MPRRNVRHGQVQKSVFNCFQNPFTKKISIEKTPCDGVRTFLENFFYPLLTLFSLLAFLPSYLLWSTFWVSKYYYIGISVFRIRKADPSIFFVPT